MTLGSIEAEKASFPIRRICRALDVSQSGFSLGRNGLPDATSSRTWSAQPISAQPSRCLAASIAVRAFASISSMKVLRSDGIARLPKPHRLRPQRQRREPNVLRKIRARPSRPKLRFRQLI
jgi:hypothetical protein